MASFDNKGKLIDLATQPLLTAAAGYGISMLLFRDFGTMTLPVIGSQNWHVGFAMVAGAASVANELAHNYILPKIARHERLANMESMLLAPVVAGAAAVVIPQLVNGKINEVAGVGNMFLAGAGAEVLGNYAFSAVVEPYLNKTK